MKPLTKNKFKIRKQRLIERINQSKSLKDIKGWERTFQYYPILKNNFEWDYDFLLDLIEFKLKKMSEYFWNHNIVVDEWRYGKICDTAINILHAGYKTEIIVESDLKNIYVNTRNVHRFLKPSVLKSYIEYPDLKKYYLPTIREEKAKKLFWKYLEHNIEKLWD